jgi:cytochrome b561
MTHLTPRPDRLANYAWHSALGYDVLALMVLRLLWRWVNPVPAQPSDSKPWERLAARLGHMGLYVLIFAVSLTGWVVANTFRVPITQDLFGLAVPQIVGTVDRATRALVEESHMVLPMCWPSSSPYTSWARCDTISGRRTTYSEE